MSETLQTTEQDDTIANEWAVEDDGWLQYDQEATLDSEPKKRKFAGGVLNRLGLGAPKPDFNTLARVNARAAEQDLSYDPSSNESFHASLLRSANFAEDHTHTSLAQIEQAISETYLGGVELYNAQKALDEYEARTQTEAVAGNSRMFNSAGDPLLNKLRNDVKQIQDKTAASELGQARSAAKQQVETASQRGDITRQHVERVYGVPNHSQRTDENGWRV